MHVHAAVIEHREGVSLFIADNAETLEEQIYDWVAEWWDNEMPPSEPMPEDQAEAIKAYFDADAYERHGESLTRFNNHPVVTKE